MTKDELPLKTDQKLDLMVKHLENLDRRDRLRSIGGFIKGTLSLIPLIFVLLSAWYFYQNGDAFIQMVTKEAVKQSAEYSQDSLTKQLEEYMKQQQ